MCDSGTAANSIVTQLFDDEKSNQAWSRVAPISTKSSPESLGKTTLRLNNFCSFDPFSTRFE